MSGLFKVNENFCAECGAILPIPAVLPAIIKCVLCKSEWPIQAREDRLVSRQERSYVKTVADAEESLLAKQDEVVQVEHICQKCGYNLASYTTQQTRSADEGQTVFYTCLKCKNRCIEYA